MGRSYRNFDEEKFRQILANKDWENIIDYSSVDSAWESLFKEIIWELDFLCPFKKFKVRSHKPSWMDVQLLEQMKDRDYFYKKAKRTQNTDDWNIAKHLRNTVNANIRQAKANFIIQELELSKNDPKKFWRVIKGVFPSKQTKSKGSLSLNDDTNKPICKDEIPNYVNDYFVNIGQKIAASIGSTTNTHVNTHPHQPVHNQNKSDLVPVKEIDVFKEVKAINTKKSSGFPNINSKCLKAAFAATIPELTNIFNLSINSQFFPDPWKEATVIPIPKPGNRKQVQNYRPISLLPLPGKLLERLIHGQIVELLEETRFLTDNQHGFRKNRTTLHAALQLVNHINTNLDRKTPTAVVFVDFRKAFDCVCYQTLIQKLTTTELGDKSVGWIQNYLSNRKQRVLVNNTKSDSLIVQQGVPQGSTLGPLFYIVYGNDIPNNLNSNVSLYADDTVLFTSSKNAERMKSTLQKDLYLLKLWCQSNKLTVNADKTKFMIFGTKKVRDKVGNFNITFDGTPIEEVSQYKYLGIKLDQTLKYDLHAKAVIQRVSDKIIYLKRIRRFITATAALSIYKNMILPILEYGDVLMLSLNVNLKKKLQTMQNKALKCALGLDPYTTSDEVHRLAKLDTLKVRREQHTLQLMFKQRDNPFLWKKKRVRRSGVLTRSAGKKQFILKKHKTERFQRSVTNKAPLLWNKLPKNIQDIRELNLFKQTIRKLN